MWLFSWLRPKHFSELRQQLAASRMSPPPLGQSERRLLDEIKEETAGLNRNNITRTKAYYDFYRKHPEMEWALLAHMVSRNAGWNMTDLKGEWLTRLFTPQETEDYFLFMERANWLIFQDAYPQLLLYEYSKEKKKSLFHLLPYLNVSYFMEVMWRDFWLHKDKARICTALIINEQNYIEKRVIEKKTFGAPVFSDIKFYLQDLLDLNMILFPILDVTKTRLFGIQVGSFPDLNHRIKLGKSLYQLLFSESVLPGLLAWCEQTTHTGSRKDYLPDIFCSQPQAVTRPYQQRLHDLSLLPDSPPIYSPCLTVVWQDQRHAPAVAGDWYRNEAVVEWLLLHEQKAESVDRQYAKLLSKLEAMIMAKELISSSF